jgi:uncharacterized SAM-binding protein YcdF (DUF218 family)
MAKRLLLRGTLLLALLGLLVLGRHTLLKQVGLALIDADSPEPTEALFVLAGGPIERGRTAALLYHMGLAPKVYCTGELHYPILGMLGHHLNEAQLTQLVLQQAGVPAAAIAVIPLGTSTVEEAHDIFRYCLHHRLRHIAVVSTAQHTRRMALVMRPLARRLGIRLRIYAAQPLDYTPALWYRAEAGLLFVVNEYLKLGYYLYKY